MISRLNILLNIYFTNTSGW